MNKSMPLLIVMTLGLAACAHGRFGDGGYYDILVQTPDPNFPNVFVVKATQEGTVERLVIDQEPIHLQSSGNTTVAWALRANSDYTFIKEGFRLGKFASPSQCDFTIGVETLECTLKGESKTLECKFSPSLFKPLRNDPPKYCYQLKVMNNRTGVPITTDPSMMAD